MAHVRQLDQIGHALGVSLIYQDIVLTLVDLLKRSSPRQAVHRRGRCPLWWDRMRGKRRLLEVLAPRAECPACAYRATLEAVYIETLIDHLSDSEFVARLREADPLCLAHFGHAIEGVCDGELFRILRDVQLEHWEALVAELGEFIRKNDHRFQHEPVGREGTAWFRALDAIAGTRKF
jgi:hypothetical protein